MEFLKFDINKCVLCGVCVEKCPFGALTIEGKPHHYEIVRLRA